MVYVELYGILRVAELIENCGMLSGGQTRVEQTWLQADPQVPWLDVLFWPGIQIEESMRGLEGRTPRPKPGTVTLY